MDHNKYMNEGEYKILLANGANQDEYKDDVPLLKMFVTNTNCVWLITEISPSDPDIAFGLCDLGMGFPELGYVSLSEMAEFQGAFMKLHRDEGFTGKFPISVYAKAARSIDEIVTDEAYVSKFAPTPNN